MPVAPRGGVTACECSPLGLAQRFAVVLRSLGVGVLATGLDLVVLALLVAGSGVTPRAASVPALACGVAAQFFGNKLLAFDDRSAAWVRQGALFLSVEAIGLVANAILYDVAVGTLQLPWLPARLLTTTLVYFGICLPLWSRIFRAGARAMEET
jgi:putative flippase GtrA